MNSKYFYKLNIDSDGDHNFVYNNIDSKDLNSNEFIISVNSINELNNNLIYFFSKSKITRKKDYLPVENYFKIIAIILEEYQLKFKNYLLEFDFDCGNQIYSNQIIYDINNIKKYKKKKEIDINIILSFIDNNLNFNNINFKDFRFKIKQFLNNN